MSANVSQCKGATTIELVLLLLTPLSPPLPSPIGIMLRNIARPALIAVVFVFFPPSALLAASISGGGISSPSSNGFSSQAGALGCNEIFSSPSPSMCEKGSVCVCVCVCARQKVSTCESERWIARARER